jgi:hypothetical protein
MKTRFKHVSHWMFVNWEMVDLDVPRTVHLTLPGGPNWIQHGRFSIDKL